jgi:ankyrin repeat protein
VRIIISGPADANDAESDEPITDPQRLRELNGLVFDGGTCGDWVDVEFLDLGISGGAIRCTYSDANGLAIVTEYSAPRRLADDQLQRLAADTSGQWSDGIGEQGFRFETREGPADVWIHYGETDMRIEQVDDGVPVAIPSPASIAARNGDIDALRSASASGEDLETRVQGMTPLHWAIAYGHVDACALLLERGADPNATDGQGHTPLLLCAIVSSLSDDTSARIARFLLEKGADQEITTPDGYSPRWFAEDRDKTLLLNVLVAQDR